MKRYAVLEKNQLLHVVSGVCIDPQSEEADDENVANMISWVSTSVVTVFDAVENALQQCVQFTGDIDYHRSHLVAMATVAYSSLFSF